MRGQRSGWEFDKNRFHSWGLNGAEQLKEGRPTIGPISIGGVIMTFVKTVRLWTGFNLLALLELDEEYIVSRTTGMSDFGLDKRVNRMTKVYDPSGTADCDRANMREYGTDCPDAIPVREAIMAGRRGGDSAIVSTQCFHVAFVALTLCCIAIGSV